MPEAPHNAGSTSLVTDPVCGMEIDPSTAAGKVDHDRQTYFFCHSSCMERFRADPLNFLARTSPRQPGSSREATYTCPMHPEVHQPTAGACPKCGMAMELVTAAAPVIKSEYVCPMHPEIVRSEPGFCPLCGMALEPRTVRLEEEANP